jgi:hypothetical protein
MTCTLVPSPERTDETLDIALLNRRDIRRDQLGRRACRLRPQAGDQAGGRGAEGVAVSTFAA